MRVQSESVKFINFRVLVGLEGYKNSKVSYIPDESLSNHKSLSGRRVAFEILNFDRPLGLAYSGLENTNSRRKPKMQEVLLLKPYLAMVPASSNGPIEAVCLSDYSDPNFSLALPLSIVWTNARTDFADFAILAQHWQQTDCNDPNWCSGADIDESGTVDWEDVGILTRHWLEAGCFE